jgi:hypothetical protein
VGFQYGNSATFTDESFATTLKQFSTENKPRDGRLYKPQSFWCSRRAALPSYLELILVQEYYLFAVSVQGQTLSDDSDFAMEFEISYSDNYANWKQYNTKTKFRVSYFYLRYSSTVDF